MKWTSSLLGKFAFVAAFVLVGDCFGGTFAGFWKGHIALPNGQELAIEVTLEEGEADGWEGRISIPAQGLRDYALSDVEISGESARFAMEGIPGRPSFAGKLDDDGSRMGGEFSQGGQVLRFELERSEAALARPVESVPEKGIPGTGLAGEWFGVLEVGPARLRLALHLQKDASGALGGSMDSLDQNTSGLPVGDASFVESVFKFSIKRVGGVYEGELSADGSELVGSWSQGGQSLPLRFLRVEKPVTLNRPQEPKPPFSYEVEEVSVYNAKDAIRLAGSLVIPKGEAPFPAVVFVSGSGAQDRDEALMGHKPFAVIADALARCGIASLRYDDRGFGKSEGAHMESTTEDFAQDALAAVRYLEGRAEIDPSWVGIVGHSEGGLVGPIAATLDESIDFLVLLAPPGEPMEKLLLRQYRAIWSLKGIAPDLVERMQSYTREEMELLTDRSLDNGAVREALWARKARFESAFSEEELAAFGFSDGAFENNVEVVSTNWFRGLLRIDPSVYLERLEVPILALFGEKDIQVDAEANAAVLRRVFEQSGNRRAEIRILPGVNHLFQNCETGGIEEYGEIEETFDPKALALICGWIERRT